MSAQVDVLAVLDHEIQRAGGEAYQSGRDLIESRAAVVALIAEREDLAKKATRLSDCRSLLSVQCDAFEDRAKRAESERDALREALQELCEIVEDAISQKSAKDMDSFTLQPARAALALTTGESA